MELDKIYLVINLELCYSLLSIINLPGYVITIPSFPAACATSSSSDNKRSAISSPDTTEKKIDSKRTDPSDTRVWK